MRIVIDMQGAQAQESRRRGIGRYTLAMTREMARLRGEHEVILALNGAIADGIEPIRAAFAGLLPAENIRVWAPIAPAGFVDGANNARRRAAEMTREAFLAALRPDVCLVTSLFEGFHDDAITSIGTLAPSLPTAVILYDLIPLIHQEIYLPESVVKRWYFEKLGHLRRADLLLAISASSGREAVEHLGFPAEEVVNISTACDAHFRPQSQDEAARRRLGETYGLTRPFVMYTGGIDHRKNIEGLIRAYAMLPEQTRAAHQLAIVCSIQPHDRARLEDLAARSGLGKDEIALTGFVPEEDLVALYNACKLFIFPSWHEGFGMPVLEAMACGRPVIGSNLSSIPEVIGREDAMFDPRDDAAIARKMAEVLADDAFRAELARFGLERAELFSWRQTAQRAWDALAAFTARRTRPAPSVPTGHRPRLAYVSPLPPQQSGIAEYSAELLPELARHYQIDVVAPQGEVSDPWVKANCPLRDLHWFRCNAGRFERVLYHFGNSTHHGHMFDLIEEIPGVVVLHDFFLSGVLAYRELNGQAADAWSRALLDAHGWPAVARRYREEDAAEATYAYPCNLKILQQARGVIVHSEFARRLARAWYGPDADADWTVVPLLRIPSAQADRAAARRALGLAKDAFVVCSFGILGSLKLNHRLLAAWLASPLAADPRCRLVFVGQNEGGQYGADMARAIRQSPAAGRVTITGWTDGPTYRAWLAAADVGVQLRTQTRGETSAAALDAMNHGLATVVNAHGSMADLPDDAVWKLPDAFSDEELTEALATLWRDAPRREALSRRGRETILADYQPRRCATRYAEAIERAYHRGAAGLPTLIDAIARIEPPLPPEDAEQIAAALDESFPLHPRPRRLYVDVSPWTAPDAQGKDASDALAALRELFLGEAGGWLVEPVIASSDGSRFRSARRFACRLLDIPDEWADDEPIEAALGDAFVALDASPEAAAGRQGAVESLRRLGVAIFASLEDLPGDGGPRPHFLRQQDARAEQLV